MTNRPWLSVLLFRVSAPFPVTQYMKSFSFYVRAPACAYTRMRAHARGKQGASGRMGCARLASGTERFRQKRPRRPGAVVWYSYRRTAVRVQLSGSVIREQQPGLSLSGRRDGRRFGCPRPLRKGFPGRRFLPRSRKERNQKSWKSRRNRQNRNRVRRRKFRPFPYFVERLLFLPVSACTGA